MRIAGRWTASEGSPETKTLAPRFSLKKSLKTWTLIVGALLFAFCELGGKPVSAFITGPPPSRTGAPGEETCVTCHTSFPLNSGPGRVSITGLPIDYLPNQEVVVSATTVHPDGFIYGFQLTALDATGAQAGTIVATDTTNTQLVSGMISGFPRTYIEHTNIGAFPVEFNQRTWTFKWVAPPAHAGLITFYAAGNGANGDGESTDDYIYTTAATIGCTLTIGASSESFAASGGTGTIGVTVGPCNWTAATADSWITITSGDGIGDGTVSYSVAPNTATSPRNGVINVSGQPFTVVQGAAFLDVPFDHPFFIEIGKLSARGVTLGCGGGNYCPDQPVTREQLAAFMIRALGVFSPPTPAMQRFGDVPPSNPFYAFIEELALRQITLGCGGGNYCPTSEVSREQMAAFVIRGLGEFNPPTPAMQRFDDVPPENGFYNFIDRMAVLGVTHGCSSTLYCPAQSADRGQVAAFLVRAFNL